MHGRSRVAKVRFRIAMSLDGYSAGPRQSTENPALLGGLQLVRPVTASNVTHLKFVRR